MWTFPIVVRNVLSNRQTQMPFTKQDELVQALGFYTENEPLREGVQVWAP